MLKFKKISLIITGLVLMLALNCIAAEKKAPLRPRSGQADPFKQNKHIGRGMNIANALEAPNEGEWGVTLKEEYFKIIKDAGFDSVRIPIRWSNHALKQSPYTIDKVFLDRVDWAVKNALKNNLYVIINTHHYFELMDEPNANSERFLALWQQIAEHYKDYPDSVLLEPLNEPHNALTPAIWNNLLNKAITVIRRSNPNRTIIAEPAEFASVKFLDKLDLPEEDRNIIVSFHYYSPMEFTHQGTSWIPEAKASWLGTRWTATKEQKKAIDDAFDKAAKWGKKNKRPINLGEFGVYKDADKNDRALWTAFVAKSAVKRGFSFDYWEFCHEYFGAYDQQTNKWKDYLLKALIPPKK
ncbi:MAG: glycoside hydrolase family 5 protein [Sedimentisphaerales bacterium]